MLHPISVGILVSARLLLSEGAWVPFLHDLSVELCTCRFLIFAAHWRICQQQDFDRRRLGVAA
jgi:hypothetical protein